MKKYLLFSLLLNFFFVAASVAQLIPYSPTLSITGKGIVNTRVDNLGYWNSMIKKGFVLPNPGSNPPLAIPTQASPCFNDLLVQDSPDVPLTNEPNVTLSENSVFIHPENEDFLLNSDNSTDWNGSMVQLLTGANDLHSEDAGYVWGGNLRTAGLENSGDPATAIGLNGWLYVGKINYGYGQSVAYSSDQGQTWHDIEIYTPTGSMELLDKNHLWIDNSVTSNYEGNLYSAWTNLVSGSPSENQIEIVRSANQGLSWSNPLSISEAVNAGSHNQGVNIQTGPDGEVYVAWAIYDSWPADEVAYGFSKSIDGGIIFTPGSRIISNTKGIRTSGTSQNMRVNSFPTMTVDISSGPYRGTIYMVWSNIGTPGINTGSDIDVWLIKSEDEGNAWSDPIRVNQDQQGIGKQHFLPWICCDPVTGNLSVIYYDDRNSSSGQIETWISYSYDSGESWSDMKVSDVAFTPSPIPGLAPGYFGDYLGISSRDRMVYPVWTDNRSGKAMTYTSPISLGPPPNQPFVTFQSYDLANMDSVPVPFLNFGDSTYMDLTLINLGDQPATLVSAVLSTSSPYITITDSSGYYGYFDPEEVKNLPFGYTVKVSDTIPSRQKVRFNVTVTSVDTTWISHFTITAHAPGLKILGTTIIDTINGNGNGRLDPGETVQMQAILSNSGDFPCQNTWVKISSGSDDLTFLNDSAYLGMIPEGENKTARFLIMTSSEACPGSSVDILLKATSGLYHPTKAFTESIGGIFEDWESNSFTTFPWTFGGNKQWQIDTIRYAGLFSARSGWIYDNQSTGLLVEYTSGADDSISFFRKVSSEANYDFLSFYIDWVRQDQWSGYQDWKRVSFPVSAGTHTYTWEYATDIYQLSFDNSAWIDNIMFPPPPLPQIFAGPSDTVCAGNSYQLHGTAQNADSVKWTTLGDGTFSDDTILMPVYFPGSQDIIEGGVKLRLKGYGENGCYTSSLFLSVGNVPVASIEVIPNDTLCSGQVFHLFADSLESATYQWLPVGSVSREIEIDTAITGGSGSRWITLKVTNAFSCTAKDSVFLTFKDCTWIMDQEKIFKAEVYPNPCSQTFALNIFSPEDETVSIRLINISNEVVMEKKEIPVSGNFRMLFDVRKFTSGEYLLLIDRKDSQTYLKILIVHQE